MDYDSIYLSYLKLKGVKSFDLIDKLGISQDDLNFFRKIGLILVNSDSYLRLEVGRVHSFDFSFYFNHFDKLDEILHKNLNTRFFIHYILFNINIYLSVENLVQLIKKRLSNFNIIESEIVDAHNVLLRSGLILKDYCQNNTLYVNDREIITAKNMWVYQNVSVKRYNDIEIAVDYIQKLILSLLSSKI